MSGTPLSRRQALALAASAALLPLAGRAAAAAETPGRRITDPKEALQALKDGNMRYVQWKKASAEGRSAARRAETASSQYPYASILSCADSRVAPEILFDAGIGDLFVVRGAGNVVTLSDANVMGSLEFATAVLGSPLIMVMGHTSCGAVATAKRTIDADDVLPGSMEAMVDALRPAVRAARGRPGDPLMEATDMNVRLGMKRLRDAHPILAPAVEKGALMVVGGVYDLRSGEVRWLSED